MEIGPIWRMLMKSKLTALLIIFQIAITLAIFSNTLLAWNTLQNLIVPPEGFNKKDLIVVKANRYQKNSDGAQIFTQDLEGLRAIPGVLEAAPIGHEPNGGWTHIRTRKGQEVKRYDIIDFETNTQGLSVLGIQLVEGRLFEEHEVEYVRYGNDEGKDTLLLLSESAAALLFPRQSAVGQTVWLGGNAHPKEVIGVYKDIFGGRIEGQDTSHVTMILPVVFLERASRSNYIIRTEPGHAESLFEAVRQTLYKVKGRYYVHINTLEAIIEKSMDTYYVMIRIFGTLSIVLFLVVSLGIAGLASYSVAKRKKHIGIRRALGATRWQIIRFFLVEHFLIALVGIGFGSLIAMGLNFLTVSVGLFRHYLGIEQLLGASFFLLLVVGISVYFPAKRSAAIAPAIVTRTV